MSENAGAVMEAAGGDVQGRGRFRVTSHLPSRFQDDWMALKERYAVAGERPADGDSEMVRILAEEAVRRMKGGGRAVQLGRIEHKLDILIMLMLGAFGGKAQISRETVQEGKRMLADLLGLLGGDDVNGGDNGGNDNGGNGGTI